MRGVTRLVPLVAALTSLSRPVGGQQVAYTGGVSLARGSYLFQRSTTSAVVYNGLDLTASRWRAWATLPVIAQSTPWVSYTGAGMVPSGGPEHGDMPSGGQGGMGSGMMGRRSVTLPDTASYDHVGVGDLLGGVSLEVLRGSATRPAIRITAAAKAPIASPDKGFGTGAWDYSGGLSVAQPLGRTLLFADAAYWALGDLDGLELRNALAYGIAVGRTLGAEGRLGVLGSLGGYTRIIAGVPAPVFLGAGVIYRLATGRSLGATLTVGLSESVPDAALALSWRLGL